LDPVQPGAGLDTYYESILEMQANVIESQRDKLLSIANRMADTIEREERIFVFGSGHSHLMAEEAFYRAGGLAAVVPVFASSLMLHENLELGSRMERTEGLAASLLDRYQPKPGEMIIIFSNSGVNCLPVEMAQYAGEKGLFVVSVSAFAYAEIAPLSSIGKRLDEASDVAVDNGGVPGDALVQLGDSGWRVGPSSTVLGALIWNCLVCECVSLLNARGSKLPVIASFNMPYASEQNKNILNHWRKTNLHLL
jgi:uncharacterized phosphosugar-binding protein